MPRVARTRVPMKKKKKKTVTDKNLNNVSPNVFLDNIDPLTGRRRRGRPRKPNVVPNPDTAASKENEMIIPTKENGATGTKENGATQTKENGVTPTKENGVTPTKENGVTPTKENEATPKKENRTTPTKQKVSPNSKSPLKSPSLRRSFKKLSPNTKSKLKSHNLRVSVSRLELSNSMRVVKRKRRSFSSSPVKVKKEEPIDISNTSLSANGVQEEESNDATNTSADDSTTESPGGGAKPYSCEFCKFTTTSSTSIKKHRARHTGEGTMVCTFSGCDYKTIHTYLMKIHIATYHTGIGLLQCRYCDLKTARRERFKVHLKVHVKAGQAPSNAVQEYLKHTIGEVMPLGGGTPKPTPVTLQKVALRNSLKKIKKTAKSPGAALTNGVTNQTMHLNNQENNLLYKKNGSGCYVIDKMINGNENINSIQKYECTQCRIKFSDEKSMISHFRLHSYENILHCEFCSFTSDDKDNMQIHLASHNGIKNILCPFCEFSCAHKFNLKHHMSTVHCTQQYDSNGHDVDQSDGRQHGTPFLELNDLIMRYHQSSRLYESQFKLSPTSRQNIYLQTSGCIRTDC